jgi:hypothetical protein
MRAALTAFLLAAGLAACATTSAHDARSLPLGRDAMLVLPASPGYPGVLNATQRVIGQYGERRAAFDAALALSPDRVLVVLTSSGGPRILSLTWTASGITENRTPLAPEDLNGLSVLGDIFLSLWPADAVQAALPADATIQEEGTTRRIVSGNRVVAEIETIERNTSGMRQRFRNLDLGYALTIITEQDP